MTKRLFSVVCCVILIFLSSCAQRHTSENESHVPSSTPISSEGTVSEPQTALLSDIPRSIVRSDGMLAAAQNTDGLWGYIDKTGNWSIQPQFFGASDFSEGLAAVKTENEYHGYVYGYIDASGAFVLKPWYTMAGRFSCGLARVTDNNSGYFYIDTTGALAFTERIIDGGDGYYEEFVNCFNFASDFNFGYALIAETLDGVCQYYIISSNGQLVLTLGKDDELHSMLGSSPDENGNLVICKNGAYGVINTDGSEVIPAIYEELYPSCDGLFLARLDGLYGYIDDSNSVVIDFALEGGTDFCSGAATAKQGGKWGVLDRGGLWLSSPVWDDARAFCDGLAAVEYAGKWGIINRAGELILPPVFDELGDFCGGLAVFSADGVSGYVNKSGEIVIESDTVTYTNNFFDSCAAQEQ